MKKHHEPNYKQIFTDILIRKHPEKFTTCKSILEKNSLTVLDILELNKLIFDTENITINQRHRSFNEATILHILDYQKKYNLNNSQLANHFRLSRNTVTKWRRLFSSK